MSLLLKRLLILALPLCSAHALSHTAWLEPTGSEPHTYSFHFGGHNGVLEPYDVNKLKTVEAYDSHGEPLPVDTLTTEGNLSVKVPEDAVLITLHYDNGIWTRDRMGKSVNRPLQEVPGATKASYSPKYHKTIIHWQSSVTHPLGQPFEVTPLSAEQPVAGQPFQVKVTLDGNPVAGVQLGNGEQKSATDGAEITDANGLATFTPSAGLNKLWAGIRLPVEGPGYTELSHEYLLTFEARPQ